MCIIDKPEKILQTLPLCRNSKALHFITIRFQLIQLVKIFRDLGFISYLHQKIISTLKEKVIIRVTLLIRILSYRSKVKKYK